MSKELVQVQFDMLHRQMLLHGPEDIESTFLWGMLIGYRDTLNKRGIVVEGVSDRWWFEHEQGPDFGGYMKRIEDRLNESHKKAINAGYELGIAQVTKLCAEIVHYSVTRV